MPMYTRQTISIGNLLLDVGNYRIVKQPSQKEARDAIIAEEGKKLVALANHIIEHGLSPIDLQLVIDAEDGNANYIVLEGNRRLTTLTLLLKPDLAEGTLVHNAFKKLHKNHADSIPKVLDCVIAPSKAAALIWIDTKHQSGMQGAGVEPWSAMSKARRDADEGIARPELDAVNFVLADPDLPPEVRKKLEGSEFNITSLKRLVETKEIQQVAGIRLQDGKLISDQDQKRIRGILGDIIGIIARGRYKKDKFTERNIDTPDKREDFINDVAEKYGKRKRGSEAWVISATPTKAKSKPAKAKTKGTLSTAEQPNLIPKAFKLDLPSGKINDIFVELKQLDVVRARHAISVLFRVFIELTLDAYIETHTLQLPKDNKGRPVMKLNTRLSAVRSHAKSSKLLASDELKPIDVAIGDVNSLLAPNTLHAYVHSEWMNPDPMQLKVSWTNIQLFIERLWTSINAAGQNAP